MSNPILSAFGRNPQQPAQQPQPSTLMGMLNSVRSSSNQNQAMQQMLSSNPQYQNVMDYINQNGGDARTAFYNMAAQKGIDPESILKQLR